MKGSVHFSYHKCHKINHVGSYIDSPDWIKNKATINPINKIGKSF